MSPSEWKIPPSVQPKPQGYGYDLERALSAVMALSATVPADAFTAETLGTERTGNAVLIRGDGLVLTIGYLITEATSVWLTLGDGRVVPGHVLGFDQETGFGLVQALARIDVPPLPIGRSDGVSVGDRVVIAGAGGRRRSVAGTVAMRQVFAGYWEYVLEDALFTRPSHPHWGGTALIGSGGDLLGIGSLQLQQERGGPSENLNMIVPIDLLPPVLDDIMRLGRPDRPARPWLGVFATEVEGKVAIAGTATRGPAEAAGLKVGDLILGAGGRKVDDLADFFRKVWSLGEAGVAVPLTVHREGRAIDVTVSSTDRYRLLRKPILH